MDRFEDILAGLSQHLKTPLTPDSQSSCLISFASGVKVQLELDKTGDKLILGAFLGELPPGRLRELILIEALKQNNVTQYGTFAFSLKKNLLVLFSKLSADSINVNDLYELLMKMIEKAVPWKEAIAQGTVPQIASTQSGGSSIFSLKT